MQITITMRCHSTSSQNDPNPEYWQQQVLAKICVHQGLSRIDGKKAKPYSHFEGQFSGFLQSYTYTATIQSSNLSSLVSITQWSWKHVYTRACTWIFPATLFIFAKTLKPPRWPSVVNGEINFVASKLKYYSVLK